MQNEIAPISPVRYADGLYYIGTEKYPSWLIESTDGVILIDTAGPNDLDFIIENIRKVGHAPSEIRHIIHSHGHFDHFGCTKALVEISGAKTYIGEPDADAVRGKNELHWSNEADLAFDFGFEPDVLIRDGDVINIGERSFRFVLTPGHTAGTVSIFFTVTHGGREYKAGTFGGAGVNSIQRWYLEKHSLPFTLREDFLRSIDKIYDEVVEVHIGNHLSANNHRDKVSRMSTEDNPFIETESWRAWLDKRRLDVQKIIAED